MVLAEDMTARISATAQLADSERLQRSVLEVLDEGVIATDPEGRLLQANPAALATLQLDLEEARADSSWWEPYNWRRTVDGSPVNMDVIVLESGQGVRDIQVEVDLPDGTSIVLSVNFQPLPVEGSPLGGLVVSFRDVTEAALESRRLVEREDRLAAAHAVAKLASWELLPDSEEVRIFQALPGDEALTGTTIPLDALLGDRDGEERDLTREDLAACLRGERDDTVRISPRVRPSGTVWLETRSRAVRDAEGRVTQCPRHDAGRDRAGACQAGNRTGARLLPDHARLPFRAHRGPRRARRDHPDQPRLAGVLRGRRRGFDGGRRQLPGGLRCRPGRSRQPTNGRSIEGDHRRPARELRR